VARGGGNGGRAGKEARRTDMDDVELRMATPQKKKRQNGGTQNG
jgi:hypothetical protein